ncbi:MULTISPECIES: DUF1007 family protein [unclassified Bartonella]|uniref:DUF1007 family protein n=1 Tax=unclassified Bartonella TaxID=2645622 RepID=UPI0021C8775B|nr:MULTISPECIES: DUF1007 family protein [unclassified Bartonella]UXN04471.1 DUF1007 family protein [Bartonella sp. HY406]UXN07465.1 DUF1007 family protein [Bartonella sp. HY761]
MIKTLFKFFFSILFIVPMTAIVQAHPHIFVDAKVQIQLDKDGKVEKLSQDWLFDALFSAGVILDFDKNGDRFLDPSELAEISKTIRESLAEFDYFQSVTVDGKSVKLANPDKLIADMKNNQLTLHIENKPKEPLYIKRGGHYSFSLYDPTFYVAVNFKRDIDISFSGLPSFCKGYMVRPDGDKILSKSLANETEDFFANPDASFDLAQRLAPKLEVICDK